MAHPLNRSILNTQEEEAPSYHSMCSTSGKNDCGVLDVERKEKTQDRMDDGTRPVHPDSSFRPKNVIIFGETGVGKSSVINLMAGSEVADTSSGLKGCTLSATSYSMTLPGVTPFCIFDTVGLEEPNLSLNVFLDAMENAHRLIVSLHNTGGVDLLLFCIRGGSLTIAMQRTYRLFVDFLCGGQVPLAVVVTNLEKEDTMENWWVRNETALLQSGINSVAHVCITAVQAHVEAYTQKREESQTALRRMLFDVLHHPKPPYVRETRNWFVDTIRRLRSFLTMGLLKKIDLTKRLEADCKLPRKDAQALAKILAKEMTDGTIA